MPRVKVDLVSC